MTFPYIVAGAVAGIVGFFTRSIMLSDEESRKPVTDNICFMANGLHKMVRSAPANTLAASWADVDPKLSLSAVQFSHQIVLLQKSLHHENSRFSPPKMEPAFENDHATSGDEALVRVTGR